MYMYMYMCCSYTVHNANVCVHHGLLTRTWLHCSSHIPFMSERVELSIELPHGDGLGIENKGVHLLKRDSPSCTLALQCWESVTKHLVTLGLPWDGWTNQHKTVTNHCSLVELDTFLHKSYKMCSASNYIHVRVYTKLNASQESKLPQMYISVGDSSSTALEVNKLSYSVDDNSTRTCT